MDQARAGDEASYADACREALIPLTLTDDPRWLALHRERLVSVAAIRDEELGPEPWVLIRLGVAVARAYRLAALRGRG